METNVLELVEIEEAVSDAAKNAAHDLTELQLALVGGGIAEVVLG